MNTKWTLVSFIVLLSIIQVTNAQMTINIRNGTDDEREQVAVAYQAPNVSVQCDLDADLQSRSPGCSYATIKKGLGINIPIQGTATAFERNTGVITVLYKGQQTTLNNPAPGVTYYVTTDVNGGPIIEEESPHREYKRNN